MSFKYIGKRLISVTKENPAYAQYISIDLRAKQSLQGYWCWNLPGTPNDDTKELAGIP